MKADARIQTALLVLCALLAGALGMKLLAAPTVEAQAAVVGQRYVAAVGPYQAGVSLLYVLDQETQRLAVYEARGGAPNSRRVIFCGARNIGLDTLLNALNDESEFKYSDLAKEFEKSGIEVPVLGAEAAQGGGND